MVTNSAPKVFVSYSYDSDEHEEWVQGLAVHLARKGVDVIFDKWHLKLGESIPKFMEISVRDADFVIVICTPKYAKKSNERKGGVGYEQQIISGQLLYGTPPSKFIPVIRSGGLQGKNCAVPTHFISALAIDFRSVETTRIVESKKFDELMRAVFSLPRADPPVVGDSTFELRTSATAERRRYASHKEPSVHSQDDLLLERIRVYAQNMLDWERLRKLDRFQLQLIGKCGSQRVSLSRLLEHHPRLVIKGSPGSSKTVFMLKTLKSLCLTLKESLGTAEDSLISPEVPVYIELGLLTPIGASAIPVQHAANGLIAMILGKLALLSQEDDPLRTFAILLEKCNVTLLLDGLNELPKDYQRECARELLNLDQQLMGLGKHKKLKIALTARIYGFTNYFEKEHWHLAEILPLEPEAIEGELSRSLGEKMAFEVLRLGHAKFRQLLSNPQHLDCFIEWCRDEDKAGLGVERGMWSKGAILTYCASKKLSEFDSQNLPLVEAFLSHLAYQTAKTSTFFAESQALNSASKTVQSCGARLDPGLLLEQVFSSGILVKWKDRSERHAIHPTKGSDIVITEYACRFEHHSIQQYFAACQMRYLWRLDEYIANSLLHEPLVIMAGILERDRLLELMKRIKNNQRLSAYILANINEPELEKELLTKTINRFIRKTDKWATQLSLTLTLIFTAWFLTLPLLAYLISANQRDTGSVRVKAVSISLSLAYLFISPALLLRWHNRKFRLVKVRLDDYELPNVIVVLRYLLARGAMKQIRSELVKLLSKIRSDDEDPRKAFVKHAIAAVSQAVDNSSYMTEDEMLERLDVPLVAAEIDVKTISTEGIAKLLRKARSPEEDRSGVPAIDLLKDWYLSNEESGEEFANLLIKIVRNTEKLYSRLRCRHAYQTCKALKIALPSRDSWLRRFFQSFSSLFKW
jgi:hypothetical protein